MKLGRTSPRPRRTRHFQLPLSGSLAHRARSEAGRRLCFQLPLSGSPYPAARPPSRLQPFNSLSRDHAVHHTRLYGSIGPCFQLPLSGSQIATSHERLVITIRAFNSLSRDHRALFRDFPALRGFPPRRPFAHLYFPATI